MIRAPLLRAGRAIALALSLLAITMGPVLSHGLPGSVLILSADGDQLNVAVQVPLEELVIAAPALKSIEKAPIDQSLAADQMSLLADYFADHFMLEQDDADLELTLVKATLQSIQSADHGAYSMLIATFTAPQQNSGEVFPLLLTYDAIMHEIRSHSATVYWEAKGEYPVGIAEFRYKAVDGIPLSELLELR